MKQAFLFTSLIALIIFMNSPCFSNDGIIELDNYGQFRKRNTKKGENPLLGIIINENNASLSKEQEEQLNELMREPNCSEVEAKAMKFVAIPSSEEFKQYRTQARVRNLLPALSGDLDAVKRRDYASSRTLSPVAPNNATYNNQDWDSDLYRAGEAGLGTTWNLNRLIYDDEITDILSEQRRFAPIRIDLLDQVHEVYFNRRKQQIKLILNPPSNRAEQVIQETEIHELTEKLNSLTGGWFSRIIETRK